VSTAYWHGGPRGLSGWILPPARTGAPSTADFGAEGVCRRDRVYLTTERVAAEMFASMCPAERVSVYLVEPVGELEADPDVDEPGLSFQAEKARILREFPMIHARRAAFIAATMADPPEAPLARAAGRAQDGKQDGGTGP